MQWRVPLLVLCQRIGASEEQNVAHSFVPSVACKYQRCRTVGVRNFEVGASLHLRHDSTQRSGRRMCVGMSVGVWHENERHWWLVAGVDARNAHRVGPGANPGASDRHTHRAMLAGRVQFVPARTRTSREQMSEALLNDAV